ncbi:DgyrCDS13146 [Dimorphilus gyrociliatus]|uniref:DgyrCDS13146 n=1 Tax=Dimorphilus gyrociliatus TaxID=2664684 RepID=A0A7I8W9S7_9ANNE|nr:DgyrCDS13146 [Dimorphilus gyrociliatus]
MENLSYAKGNIPAGYEIKYNTVDYFLDRYDEEEGLVTLSSYWKRFSDNRKAQEISHIILIEDEKLDNVTNNVIFYKDLIKECSVKPKLPRVQNDEDLIILTTSGSVGKPKLVQKSQRGYINFYTNIAKSGSIVYQGVGFSDRPLSYTGGIGYIFSFMNGMKYITTEHSCSNENTVTTKHLADIISTENCTSAVFFGYLLYDMVNDIESFKRLAKSVKVIITSGQEIVMPIIHRLWETFPAIPIIDVYAATETGMIFSRMRTKVNPNPIPSLAVGAELSIRDKNGDVTDRNQIGQIWVRTVSQMKYYLTDPMQTSLTITTSGWLKTADLALITNDGDIVFQGRINDVLKIATLNQYPQPIENKMNTQRCIEISIIIGLPDDRLGTIPCLIVELKKEWRDKRAEARREIENFWNEHFKNDKESGEVFTLSRLLFINKWPLTSSQKILRRELINLCQIGKI